MTQIGLAYNQKPDPVPTASHAADIGDSVADEEPPSNRRDVSSRSSASPASGAGAAASPTAVLAPDDEDEFAEWDSAETIAAVERALCAFGPVVRLEANEEFPERLRRERPAIVFNIAEGLHGVNREAHVPAICEFFDVPYSGSDPFTLSLCLDKARAKETLAFHGVPTAAFALVHRLGDLDSAACRALAFPLFAKPVHEGSSKGITERNYCRTPLELREQTAWLLDRYQQPVLVEEFLPGAEFTCAVLGNGGAARMLPVVSINFAALPEGAVPVYGYEAKWVWDRPENPLEMFECPARIDERLRAAIERVTLGAYRALGCRDWSRVDVRLDARGAPRVIEVNPLPGILPRPEDNSCLPKAARAAGLSYDALIQSCLLAAAARQGVALPSLAR